MQEIKEAVNAARVSGFEQTAAASVASGLAKSTDAAKNGQSEKKPSKSLKAFEAIESDSSSSSEDEDDSNPDKLQ